MRKPFLFMQNFEYFKLYILISSLKNIQVKIIARLQYLMLPVLISSLEMLYSECVVPAYLKNQWFFEE